jgi:anti-anti-sigma regulatory factor
MIEGMHLTPIGDGNVLLEPGEGIDPGNHDIYLTSLLEYLQQHNAQRLLYDLKNVRIIDSVYYRWLTALSSLCRISGIELITVNMRPAAAYALAIMLDKPPPFCCALDIDSTRMRSDVDEEAAEKTADSEEIPTSEANN